jgi:hypothetical protein
MIPEGKQNAMLVATTGQWEMKRLKQYVCSVNLKPSNVQKLDYDVVI